LTFDEAAPMFFSGDVMRRVRIRDVMWRMRVQMRVRDFTRRARVGIRRINDADLEPARYLNLALASWLLVSAFLWSHSEDQFLVTAFVGALVAIVAPFEVGSPRVRTITAAAGAFLVVAAVALPRSSSVTLWHNAIVGLLMMGISFFGPPHGIMRPRPEAPAGAYDGVGM